MAGCVMYDIIAVVGGFRSVIGMATVANMMSQVMRNKAKVTDPVSTAVYKQFKQASGSFAVLATLLLSYMLLCWL